MGRIAFQKLESMFKEESGPSVIGGGRVGLSLHVSLSSRDAIDEGKPQITGYQPGKGHFVFNLGNDLSIYSSCKRYQDRLLRH